MTLKEVRYALRVWGRFWAEKEMGLGYASRSITATMMEIGALGVSARSDKHLHSHGSSGMYVPEHICEVGAAIDEYLRLEERQLIRAVYVQNRKPNKEGQRMLLSCETVLSRAI